jgi:quaternary ammonium compound-resistance protein SugE
LNARPPQRNKGGLIVPAYIGMIPIFVKGKDMAWIILVIAGLFEIGWAIGLKYTQGFTRLWPTVGTVLAIIISLRLLALP